MPWDWRHKERRCFALLGQTTARDAGLRPSALSSLPPQSPIFLHEFRPPSVSETSAILGELDAGKAPGLDGTPSLLYKSCHETLAVPFCDIATKIIRTSDFPSVWKTSLLFPVHKGGDLSAVSNYRPISLLPVASKVIERFLADQLIVAVEEAGILSPAQFGFRVGRNCEQAAWRLVDYVSRATDGGLSCVAIFCDVKKAFDSIPHDRLLSKLGRLGLGDRPLKLLRSYLEGRSQIFRHQSQTSSPCHVPCGVPQGSVLGPLLFLLYVNDLLADSEEVTFVAFADDTTLLLSDRDSSRLEACSTRAISDVLRWMSSNGLVLNGEKTKYMVFGRRSANLEIVCHRADCPRVGLCSCYRLSNCSRYKFLGLHLDPDLKFNSNTAPARMIKNRLRGKSPGRTRGNQTWTYDRRD